MFYIFINGLAQVPFEGVLTEAYEGTRNTILNLDRFVIQLASIDSRFPLKLLVHGTCLLLLKLRHWMYLDKIFFKISVHPFRIIP